MDHVVCRIGNVYDSDDRNASDHNFEREKRSGGCRRDADARVGYDPQHWQIMAADGGRNVSPHPISIKAPAPDVFAIDALVTRSGAVPLQHDHSVAFAANHLARNDLRNDVGNQYSNSRPGQKLNSDMIARTLLCLRRTSESGHLTPYEERIKGKSHSARPGTFAGFRCVFCADTVPLTTDPERAYG